jgi:putative DNA primase/helicase
MTVTEQTYRERLLECVPDWDTFCAWDDEQLELADGDQHAPLHPKIVERLDAIRPAVDAERFNAPGGPGERLRQGLMLFEWEQERAERERERESEGTENPYKNALMSCADFKKISIPAKRYHLYPFLWSGSYGFIAGARGVGKTWYSLGMANAMTRGEAFGPWKCHEAASVMYLEAEMSLQDDQERIAAMDLASDRAKPFYMISNAYITEILRQPVINLGDAATRAHLRELILDNDIDVVFFDNVASLTPGIDENSKQEWDAVNQFMIALRYAGVSPWLIHHLGKSGDQRGTSGREDNIDIAIRLLHPRDYVPTDGARFLVNFNKTRIPHRDLPLIADREISYRPDETGQHCWVFSDPDRDNELAVLDMLLKYHQQKDIAKALNVSPGQVSKIKSKVIQKGWLSSENLLTDAGKNALVSGGYEVEI